MAHVCPWWGGYFIDNRFRRLLHKPEAILSPYVRPGMTALDFGCGMGFFAIPMARLVGETGRVIAADLQQKMLDTLQKRARKAGVGDRVRGHCCAPDSLGLTVPLDFVVAFYSVHEAPDAGRLLSEIHECLREESCLLVVEPVGHVGAKRFERLVSLGREVGFTVAERPRVRLSRAVLLKRESGPAK